VNKILTVRIIRPNFLLDSQQNNTAITNIHFFSPFFTENHKKSSKIIAWSLHVNSNFVIEKRKL